MEHHNLSQKEINTKHRRRVVVTGLGIVSAIGNDKETVVESLREGISGMVNLPEMGELGYRCNVYAPIKDIDCSHIQRRALRNMSTAATYATLAALEALQDAGLEAENLSEQMDPGRIAIAIGTAGAGMNEIPAADKMRQQGKKLARLGGLGIVKIMNSTASGVLAAYLGVQGRTCSISAACATGLYNIGHAAELIQMGAHDLCICGSTEEDQWKHIGLSADNSAGMPSAFNDQPTRACRPYDRDRQGFVMSAGSGILVVEELEHARRRGAHIYAEILGYGAANDGDDMFVPMGEGLRRSIEQAMNTAHGHGVEQIDYINAHGTGTQIGDQVEVEVLKSMFGNQPLVSSTKSLSGHSQGATAAQEAVFTALMLEHNFVAATKNLEHIAPECEGIRHVQTLWEGPLSTAMKLSSGLGGTNACLILRKMQAN